MERALKWDSGNRGSVPGSAAELMCDLGQVTVPACQTETLGCTFPSPLPPRQC